MFLQAADILDAPKFELLIPDIVPDIDSALK